MGGTLDLDFGLGGINQVVPRMIQEQNKLHGVETQLLVPSASKYRTNLGFICHSTTNLETIEKTIVNTFKPDLAVFHGLYIKEYIKLSQLFDRLSIPYAIVPHGGFSRVVQGKGRLKKTVANHLFFRKFISKASAILFLTEGERQNSFFHHDKAFIAPNGIDSVQTPNFGHYAAITSGFKSFLMIALWYSLGGLSLRLP